MNTNTEDTLSFNGEVARSSIMRAVNFQIEIVVGEATMKLDALEEMAAGTILPIAASLSDVVSLRLNGVEIARGELVSVEDMFAVKITQVTD